MITIPDPQAEIIRRQKAIIAKLIGALLVLHNADDVPADLREVALDAVRAAKAKETK